MNKDYLKAIYWPPNVKKDGKYYLDVEWHGHHDQYHKGKMYDENTESLLAMNIPSLIEYININYTRDVYL